MKKLWELFAVFFKIGILTFGGGYVMMMLAKKEVVEKRKWATEQDILDYIVIGTCTPGIIAVNIATFVGCNVKGKIGGITATLGLITPSMLVVTMVATILREYMHNAHVISALSGIKIVVVALLASFVLDMAKKNVRNPKSVAIFLLSLALLFFGVHIAVVFVIAGISGYLIGRLK